MPQNEKDMARRVIDEAWNKGNLAVIDDLVAPHCVMRHPSFPEDVRGVDAYKRTIARYRAAFPDLRFTVEDIISEGNVAVTRYNITGTHRGEFNGIAPTGKKVTWTGVSTTRTENGQLVEQLIQSDHLGLLRQLGALTETRPTAARTGRP